ncbi:DeoR family transcriptional regulator [Methanobrevibacter smithii]
MKILQIKKYGELFEVSRSTAARDLRRLVELNLIQKYEISGKEVIYSIK